MLGTLPHPVTHRTAAQGTNPALNVDSIQLRLSPMVYTRQDPGWSTSARIQDGLHPPGSRMATPARIQDTHQRAFKVEGVGEDHISLPVLDLEETGALGGAAVLGGGLSSRGRGLEKKREGEQ